MNMKNIFKSLAALFVGCAMLAVSCQKPDDVKVEPQFPQVQEFTVTPGQTVTLNVEANLDWEISVPENTMQWFWIQDGSFELYKVSGKAGAVEVVIGVSEKEEFDQNRSCEVTMTMGGKSQVVAKLMRPSKEKTLDVYAAIVTDGEVQFTEEGDYAYQASTAESLDLIWTGSDFRLPIKVESNYPWTIKTPQWAQLDVPANATGTQEVIVFGVPSEYPLQAASGKLQFMAGDEVVKEYTLNIPGCEDIFSYRVDMSLTDIIFNYAGQIKTLAGFIEGPLTATISGTSKVRVVAVEGVDGTYDLENPVAPAWLDVAVQEYDATEGAEVLQSRTVTITAALNEGDDRSAAIFFLPPNASGSAEELMQYCVPVTQLSSDQEFISMLSNPSDMAAGGATFAVSEDADLFNKFGQTRYAYELVYTNQYARDNAHMSFTSAVTSYKVFDESGADKTGVEDFFLSLTLTESALGGVIDMAGEVKAAGYVVLYGASGNVLAVVKCTLDPEEVIGEVADVAFIGESEMYAPMVGATLEDVSESSEFKNYKEGNALLYHLRYTMEKMPMTISIPASIKKHTVNPYAFRHNIRVNDTKYDEDFVNGVLGGVALVDGGVTIYMEMPEGRDYFRGNIIFTNGSDETILVLVCTLDLRETAE